MTAYSNFLKSKRKSQHIKQFVLHKKVNLVTFRYKFNAMKYYSFEEKILMEGSITGNFISYKT